MRQLLLVVPLMVVTAACAGHHLVPKEQAAAIKHQHRALAPHAAAIQANIRESGRLGALAFLDAGDGRLVVLPGDTPTEAWARHRASSSSGPTGRVSVPPVVTFVHRADVPKAPESVTYTFLQQQETLRTTLATLDAEFRRLSDSVAANQTSIATAREDLQKALDAVAQDLAAVRKSMLQTVELARLNQEMTVENATGIRKLATSSQEVSASSAKFAEAMRHLSDTLTAQLKELSARLDAIQNQMSKVK